MQLIGSPAGRSFGRSSSALISTRSRSVWCSGSILLHKYHSSPPKKMPKVCNIVGGVLSPILANAYLHELDEFVEGLQAKLEKGKRKQRNPPYQQLSHQKSRMVKRGETKTKEFQRISQLMRTMPTLQVDDPGFIRIKYLRYADDWIVGIWGNRALAEQIKQEIKNFLNDQLRLTLSEEKTHITHARTEESLFLGTRLKV